MITEFDTNDLIGFAGEKVTLKPLTALIGDNGSGKSWFLSSLYKSAEKHAQFCEFGPGPVYPPTIHRAGTDLVLIEYAEHGVHPSRLQGLVERLRALTRGVNTTRPTQVVFITYSPYLLDHLDLTCDQVLVFLRLESGETTVRPISDEVVRNYCSDFALGELWWNHGEARLTGLGGDDVR